MKRMLTFLAIVFSFLAAIFSASVPDAAGESSPWVPNTIASAGDVGYYTSIAIDSKRNLHISYCDWDNKDLKYATNASGSWVTTTLDSTGDTGYFTSIALDTDDKVHISYVDATNGYLKYATNAGGSWSTPTTIDNSGNVGYQTAIAVDVNKKAHISYIDSTNGYLMYATNAPGPTWNTMTVDNSGYVGSYTSIAVDANSKVHISYQYVPVSGAFLNYATNASNPSFDIITVDSGMTTGDIVGAYNDIALDANGKAHISYFDDTNGNLKHATNVGGSWSSEIVDDSGVVVTGHHTSIAIDSLNRPHISYQNASTFDLKYAIKPGPLLTWDTIVVDSNGYYTSIAADSTNKIFISYYGGAGGDLKYAYNGYDLTVSKTGAGSGTVKSSLPGVDCGAACNSGFGENSVITLQAIPAAGSYFKGWSGTDDCFDRPLSCKVTMDAAETVNAEFETGYPVADTWAKTYGGFDNEELRSFTQIEWDHYVIAGSKYSPYPLSDTDDFWLLRIDKDGNPDWQKVFHNANDDIARGIDTTADGGFVFTGITDYGDGSGNIWVIRTDWQGDVIWENSYEEMYTQNGYSVQQTADGGFIVAGDSNDHVFLMKLDDVDGSIIWQKNFETEPSFYESVRSIRQTADGGYVIAAASFPEGPGDFWILKLDRYGNSVWQKTYGDSYNEEPFAVQQTSDGGYIVAGYKEETVTGYAYKDFWVLKLYPDGTIDWEKTYGDTYADAGNEIAHSLVQTIDGGYILAGSTDYFGNDSEDFWVIKLDQSGGIEWEKTYGGGNSDVAYAIQQIHDNSYIVMGQTQSFGAGSSDILIVKIDQEGNIGSCPIAASSSAHILPPESSISTTNITGENYSLTKNPTSAVVTETSIAPSAICGIVSWLNPVDGNWDGESGFNWDTGTDPTVFNDVFITVPCNGTCSGTGYNVHLGTNAEINSLNLGNPGDTDTRFLHIYDHSLTLNSASLIGQRGQITGNNCFIHGSATLTVNGILYLFNDSEITTPIDLYGQIVVNGSDNAITGNITPHGTSRIAIIGVSDDPVINPELTFINAFTNYGLIELGTNVVGPVARLTVPAMTNASTGIIQGEGNVIETSGSTIINGGTVNPGSPIGILSITLNYTQQPSGILNIQLGGTAAGTQYDRLAVSGTATLAGTLNVTLTGGFIPSIGNSFTVLTYYSRTGSFSTINLPALPQGRQWNTAYTSNALVLSVIATPTYSLTVAKGGTGSGTVSSNPAGITCGSTCSADFISGSPVSLTANPATDSVFAGWSGDCSGSAAQTSVTMNSNRSCTATFTIRTFTITATVTGGNGTISCTSPVNYGESSTCTISPAQHYHLATLADNYASVIGQVSNSSYQIHNVTGNHSVTGTFTRDTYAVSTEAGKGGNISPKGAQVPYNDTVQFTITPDAGYHIKSVSGCGGTLAGSSLTGIKKQKNKKLGTLAISTYSTGPISEDCTVTASFELNIYLVSTSSNPGGSISPGSAEVSHGETAQFTITPETGYHIVSVAGCNGQISGGLPAAQAKKRNALNLNYTTPISYVTEQITAACTVTASFEINSYTVSTSSNTGGSISPASEQVPHGETTQFTVIPDIGYSIKSVTGCGGTLSGTPTTHIKKKKKTMDLLAASSYTTDPITEDCTVTATFETNTYTVSTSINTGGNISPEVVKVTHGETAQFTITPDLGYHLVSVSGCGEGKVETGSGKIFRKKKLKSINLLSAVTYTTGPITEDCSVMATFEINTYTISTTTTQGGGISPASTQVTYDATAEFIITPDTGYHIESVEGCNGMLSGNTYTTGKITGECTVSAVFAKDFRSVTITVVSGNGTISADGLTCTGDVCTGTYEYGKKIILTLNPDAGYRVSDVKINGVSIGAVNTITLKNLTADTMIEVIFTEI